MREVAINGRRFFVADDKPSFWSRAEAGLWEPELLAELAETLRPGAVFLDVGGWVGPTSLFAAACGATVLALEPDPAAARQFRANLAVNPTLSPQIALIEAALTPEAGRVALGSPRKPGDSMGSLLLAAKTGIAWQADAITPEKLAGLIPEGRPLVIKIDIEGGEYVLGAALSSLAACKPERALVAFHPALLLSAENGGPDALKSTTAAVFAAFEGMISSVLGHSAGNPVAEALQEAITVRFSRA